MNARVLVTGATGLLGRAVLARLPVDVAVRAVSRSPAPPATPRVEWRAADLARDAPRGLAGGCTAVIHCAGVMASDEANFALNRDGTRALLEEARHAGVRRFVHVSSTAVYGDHEHVALAESAARAGTSSYARSKIEAEDAVLGAPLEAVVIRPCMITGPGDRNLLPAARELFAASEVMLPGGGRKRLDLVLADDVAALLVRCALRSGARGVYHATGGRPESIRDLLREAARSLGRSPRWRSVPLEPAPDEELSSAQRAVLWIGARERTYSIERARRELAYAPDPRPPLAVALAAS
jgi:nucleoside-diphosphate-sugar epimerase